MSELTVGEHKDRTIQCVDCGGDFIFTAGEQDYYKSKEFFEPKRCTPCRRNKRPRYTREEVVT